MSNRLSKSTKDRQANSYTCYFQEHTLMTPRPSNCKPDTKLENGHSDEVPDERLLSALTPKQGIARQYMAEKTQTFTRI